jgi:hypothetical protein
MKAREVCWMITVTDMSTKEVFFPILLLTMMMVLWTFIVLWLIPKMNRINVCSDHEVKR